jgi:hypothetical protein
VVVVIVVELLLSNYQLIISSLVVVVVVDVVAGWYSWRGSCTLRIISCHGCCHCGCSYIVICSRFDWHFLVS